MRLPVTLSLRRSRRLAAALVLAHAVAAAGLLPTAVPSSLKLLAMTVLLASLAAALYRHVLRCDVSSLTLRGDGQMEVAFFDGSSQAATVHHRTTVLPWLVVLWFNAGGGLRALPLLRDSLGGDDGRQLRLWLRWRAMSASGA